MILTTRIKGVEQNLALDSAIDNNFRNNLSSSGKPIVSIINQIEKTNRLTEEKQRLINTVEKSGRNILIEEVTLCRNIAFGNWTSSLADFIPGEELGDFVHFFKNNLLKLEFMLIHPLFP